MLWRWANCLKLMDRWFPRKPNLRVTQAPRNWGVRRKQENSKNEKRKEKGKHITRTTHPHKNEKRRAGFKEEEWLAESPSFTAWKPLCSVTLPVPLWNLPEETDRGLGEWGCYGNWKEHTWRQSPERSREGYEREKERGKSLCVASATVFSGEMRTRQNIKEQD